MHDPVSLYLIAFGGLLLAAVLLDDLADRIKLPGILLVLALGYMWLAIGSAFAGTHLLAGRPVLPALHLIVVGALGTLSGSVMLRLAWQRARRTFPPAWQVIAIAILVAAASISRYLAGAAPYSQPLLLWFSAGCWTLTFGGIAGQVLGLYPGAQKPHTARNTPRK